MKHKTKEFLLFSLIIFFTVILELALNALKVKEENIYLVFVLSILIIIIEFKSIRYGILASVLTVLSFNFFITEPKFTFVVDDPNNYVSFVMFVLVSIMVNSLVLQLQRQIVISKENEKRINALYNISTDILHSHSSGQTCQAISDSLNDQIENDICLCMADGQVYGKPIDTKKYADALDKALKRNIQIDDSDPSFPDLPYRIFPIRSGNGAYGVIVAGNRPLLSKEETVFIENVIEELVIALDKDQISMQQEQTKLQVEREKFRSSLLKGLSHDLKTPLTMIQSGSQFLHQSFDSISDSSKKELIYDIYNESCDLSDFVNNLLDLTRLDGKDTRLNRVREPADSIISQVLEKMKRSLADTKVEVIHPEQIVMVYADMELLYQVFYNLIDNVLTHTPKGTSITIAYEEKGDHVVFRVEDDGGGISEEKIDLIFEDFYSLSVNEDKKRSHGLGLGICRSIVEAHGGSISARNNEKGGATFEFTIGNGEN